MKRVLCAALLAAIFSAPPLQGKSWRGIEPLRSTKSDVERVLGKARRVANHWATYETDTEAISILYSNGLPCGAGANSEWRASEGLVISITVAPKTIVAFSSLSLDESKYKKRFDPHRLNHIEYSNEEEGESISVTNGEVSSFTYSPSNAKIQLKCPTADGTKRGAESSYKLDEYGELKRNDEASRLDNFAIALRQRPGSQGYIFSYAGGAITPSRARMRAKRAKNYLVKVRNVKSSRLKASYAGESTDFTIELYIRPPQARAPVPFILDTLKNP